MFKNILIILNITVAGCLLIAHYAAGINPNDFWLFSFSGLVFPFFLIANILFLFLWLFYKNKWPIVIPLISLLLSFSSTNHSFQLSLPSNKVDEVSIMTWNIKNLDFYAWSGIENSKEKIVELLKKERPNILCLQEFYSEKKGEHNNVKLLAKELNYPYYYFYDTYQHENKRKWGLIIFSEYKIETTGGQKFEKGTRLNAFCYADINLSDNQKARIYNIHLQSNQFSQEDYDYIENITEKPTEEGIIRIFQKLKNGYINRAEQINTFITHKNESPFPSIVCGDFNDTPVSYTYTLMNENMQDAFVEKGLGFGRTYHEISPFLRIDYTFLHPIFNVTKFKSFPTDLSDHYPIKTSFTF